jgi:hypothetical protein
VTGKDYLKQLQRQQAALWHVESEGQREQSRRLARLLAQRAVTSKRRRIPTAGLLGISFLVGAMSGAMMFHASTSPLAMRAPVNVARDLGPRAVSQGSTVNGTNVAMGAAAPERPESSEPITLPTRAAGADLQPNESTLGTSDRRDVRAPERPRRAERRPQRPGSTSGLKNYEPREALVASSSPTLPPQQSPQVNEPATATMHVEANRLPEPPVASGADTPARPRPTVSALQTTEERDASAQTRAASPAQIIRPAPDQSAPPGHSEGAKLARAKPPVESSYSGALAEPKDDPTTPATPGGRVEIHGPQPVRSPSASDLPMPAASVPKIASTGSGSPGRSEAAAGPNHPGRSEVAATPNYPGRSEVVASPNPDSYSPPLPPHTRPSGKISRVVDTLREAVTLTSTEAQTLAEVKAGVKKVFGYLPEVRLAKALASWVRSRQGTESDAPDPESEEIRSPPSAR